MLTDPAADDIRATKDVDAVIEATSFVQYHQAELRLSLLDFVPDDTGPRCRWVHRPTGVLLDLMPLEAEILGFTNRWYPEALRSANRLELRPGLAARLIAAPAFVATKLEAFRNRGKSDYGASHDLEDVLIVVDGRPELPGELNNALPEMRNAVARQFDQLLHDDGFLNFLPGLVPDPERTDLVMQRLIEIAAGAGKG